jgi:hypothetical protein
VGRCTSRLGLSGLRRIQGRFRNGRVLNQAPCTGVAVAQRLSFHTPTSSGKIKA